MTNTKGVVKEPCLLVPSRQSSDASGQFGLDFQGPKSFELNLKLLNFSHMDTQICPYTDLQPALCCLAANEHSLTILLKFQSASDCDRLFVLKEGLVLRDQSDFDGLLRDGAYASPPIAMASEPGMRCHADVR